MSNFVKIKLDGPLRYNHAGEMFLAGTSYLVDQERAQYLLDQYDPTTGYPFFAEDKSESIPQAPKVAELEEPRVARRERPQVPPERQRKGERPVRRARPEAARAEMVIPARRNRLEIEDDAEPADAVAV